MSTEETPSTTSDTPKATLTSEVVRPPDLLRDAKNNPTRPGFREKANAGSKASKGKSAAKKKKR